MLTSTGSIERSTINFDVLGDLDLLQYPGRLLTLGRRRSGGQSGRRAGGRSPFPTQYCTVQYS